MEHEFPIRIFRPEKRDCLFRVPLLPEIFRWNDPKSRVPLTFQPDFPEHFGKCKCLTIDFSLSKATNYKAITCKLRDITTHSKALITWPGLASSFEVTFIPVILEPAWRRHFYKAIGSSVHVSRLVHSPIHPKSLITWRISRRAGSIDM